jgi:hypothetical protein
MSEPRVSVNAEALRRVLIALTGPGHLIRELQFTRDKPPILTGNPIDTLIREFNEAAAKDE